MKHLRNVDLSTFERFLTLVNCEYISTNSGHKKYGRADLARPIIFQTHIDPVPEFIIKNALRALNIDKKQFWQILDGKS